MRFDGKRHKHRKGKNLQNLFLIKFQYRKRNSSKCELIAGGCHASHKNDKRWQGFWNGQKPYFLEFFGCEARNVWNDHLKYSEIAPKNAETSKESRRNFQQCSKILQHRSRIAHRRMTVGQWTVAIQWVLLTACWLCHHNWTFSQAVHFHQSPWLWRIHSKSKCFTYHRQSAYYIYIILWLTEWEIVITHTIGWLLLLAESFEMITWVVKCEIYGSVCHRFDHLIKH